jgi:methanogenic corrinoid protein MtbC1
MPEPLLMRYMQPLLAGRRGECFALIGDAVRQGRGARELLLEVVWPAINQVARLYHDDRIGAAVESMACRINRSIADQLQSHLPASQESGKALLVYCAAPAHEEIAAQIVADLFQADGWRVHFLGGAIPADEILQLVGQIRPDILLVYGSEPQAVPDVRSLIHLIRDVGVCPTMNIVVSGGVFNRAEGLWREVGADLFAELSAEMLESVNALGPRQAAPPRVGLVKKRRRRRKADAPAAAAL